MGARTQVKVTGHHHPVYLYAHWGAGLQTLGDVQQALKMQARWDDPEYLVRIIFCQMVQDDIEGTTGFGISTSMHGDLEELIIVDTSKQKVYYMQNYGFQLTEFAANPEAGKQWTFKQFIAADLEQFFKTLNNEA